MKLFDVYPLYAIEPSRAEGCYVWDKEGTKYLDLYGGHAVISIGHNHPHYKEKLKNQLDKIVFYSNSVVNNLQIEFAQQLGKVSGYTDYSLFLCNSGAEANENALKLASFHNNKKRIIAFYKSFHGRTSAAVAVTDNPNLVSPVNSGHQVTFLPINDSQALEDELKKGDVSSVIIEGIQGIAGIVIPSVTFLKDIETLCKKYEAIFIADEVQSGYGRSGKFFAHQYAGVRPDLITTAKGMGNGFPIGGLLISPKFESRHGMLGTTFGGNYLACAAGIAVLDVLENEKLIENARIVGDFLMTELSYIKQIKEVRGQGLIIGLEFEMPIADLRKKMLFEKKIFTGYSGKNVLRLLPPLNLSKEQAQEFITALKSLL